MSNHHPAEVLDQRVFDRAAKHVVRCFRAAGRAVTIQFEPGDATQYEFTFVFGTRVDVFSDWELAPASVDRRHWLVALTDMAAPYPWNPGVTHWGYAAEKWGGCRGEEWRGRVVARLLTTIAEQLEEDAT